MKTSILLSLSILVFNLSNANHLSGQHFFLTYNGMSNAYDFFGNGSFDCKASGADRSYIVGDFYNLILFSNECYPWVDNIIYDGVHCPGENLSEPNCGSASDDHYYGFDFLCSAIEDIANTDITPNCNDIQLDCGNNEPPGSSPLPYKMMEAELEGSFSLPTEFSECTTNSFTIALDVCCRSQSYTSLDNSVFNDGIGRSPYISVLVVNPNIQNTTPEFNGVDHYIACNNQPLYINFGATDAENDELTYSIIPARNVVYQTTEFTYWGLECGCFPISCQMDELIDINIENVVYEVPYNEYYPLSTTTGNINYDYANGVLSFVPNLGGELALFAVQVVERRGGQIISISNREISVFVESCENASPQLTGFNCLSNYEINVCKPNDFPLNFTICAYDIDDDGTPSDQNLTMTVNGLPSWLGFSIIQGTDPVATFASNTIPAFGDYNFNVSVTDDGCPINLTTIANYTIHVLPEYEATITGDNQICEGESTLLTLTLNTGAPPFHVVWSNGQTCNVYGLGTNYSCFAIVTPSATTTYEATITDANGFESCLAPFEITVTVYNNPNPPIIANNDPSPLCTETLTGSYTISNFNSSYSYIPDANGQGTVTGTAPNFFVDWNNGLTDVALCVTAIDQATGCETTACIDIELCCVGENVVKIINYEFSVTEILTFGTQAYTDLNGYMTGNTFSTVDKIQINNIWTIDIPDFTIQNCPNLLFGPDARIIDNDVRFGIFSIINSTLTTECDEMWWGVYVGTRCIPTGPDTKFYLSNSTINNARNAIVNEGPTVNMEIINSNFDKNYIDIKIVPVNNNSMVNSSCLIVTGNHFTCSDFMLKPHETEDYTYKCIEIGDNTGGLVNSHIPVAVGAAGLANRNYFERFDYGIWINGTDAIVLNNTFSDFAGEYDEKFAGMLPRIAVYSKGKILEEHYLRLNNGNVSSGFNSISDGNKGVYTTDFLSAYIENVHFTDLGTGVHVFNCSGRSVGNTIYPDTLRVKSNNFNNMTYYGVRLEENYLCKDSVLNNNLTNVATTGLGIYSGKVIVPTKTSTVVYNNEINNFLIGISFFNENSSQINDNEVNLPQGSSINPRVGISVYSGSFNSVKENDVNAPTNSNLNHLLYGIKVYRSSRTAMTCNDIRRCNWAMSFYGICATSAIKENDFVDSRIGFVLSDIDGQIGTQGTATQSSQNIWYGNYLSPTHFHSSAENGANFHTPGPPIDNWWWYAMTSITADPTTFPTNNFPANPNHLDPTNVPYNPNFLTVCLPDDGTGDEGELMMMVQDSSGSSGGNNSVTGYEEEIEFLSKQTAFEILVSDSVLLDGNVDFQIFMDTTEENAIGKIDQVAAMIDSARAENDSAKLAEALNLNSSLDEIFLMELNSKTVRNIYINSFVSGVDTLTGRQYEDLYSIAIQCPLEGGKAVYEARALLNLLNEGFIDYDSLCLVSSNNRMGDQEMKEQYTIIALFPNPASSSVIISLSGNIYESGMIEIFNDLGEKIEEVPIGSLYTHFDLSLEKVKSGIYNIVIRGQNGSFDSCKLVVIK